jgi:hypothetical protein
MFARRHSFPTGARQRGHREASAQAPFSSRWVRIFSITTGSSMQAMILTAPPHSRQVSMSTLNTRLRRPLQGPTFGAPSSSMPVARRGFARGPRRWLWVSSPCPAWPGSPPHGVCCSVRTHRESGFRVRIPATDTRAPHPITSEIRAAIPVFYILIDSGVRE